MAARRAGIALSVCLAALPLVAADVASAAAPVPGARYDGKAAGGLFVFMRASREGATLSDYSLAVRMRCDDGRRRILRFVDEGEPPTTVGADRRFRFVDAFTRFSHFRGRDGRRVRGRVRFSFDGVFQTGDVVTGTARGEFRSRRLDCESGPAPYSVYRDGTSRAPYRNARVATGRYSARGRGLRFKALRVFAPGRYVRLARFDWSAPCSVRGPLRMGSTYTYLPLKGSRVAFRDAETVPLNRGGRARLRMRLRMRFRRTASGRYVVAGTWRARAVVMYRGRRVSTCRTGTRRFSGRFRSGPRNLF